MAGLMTTLMAAMRGRRPDPRPRRPLGPLLLDEARHAVRRILAPGPLAAAAVAGTTVYVVLGPTTPGLVLASTWRPFAAILLALLAAAFAHFLLRRTGPGRRPAGGSRPGPGGRDGPLPTPTDRPVAVVAIAAIALVVTATLVIATFLDAVTSTTSGAPPIDASLPADPAIALGAVLFGAAIVTSALGRRLGVPTALLFLGLGVVVGPGGTDWVALDVGTIRTIAILSLVVIMFHGGVTTTPRDLRTAAAPGAILATVGVVVTAAITTGIVLVVVPEVSTQTAWLVGAVVASTDAAALANLLRDTRLPHRLRALLTIESGANDPVAVLLTVGIIASWGRAVAPGAWIGFALWQLVGGLAVGVAAAAVGARLMDRVALPGPSLYPVLAVAIAGSAYGVAAVAGASGLLATATAGVVLAAAAPRHRRSVQRFTDGVSSAVEVGLFMVLGLQVEPAGLLEVAVPGIVIALGLALVARPVAVVVSLVGFRLPWREVGVTGWFGIRGAVPIVLATYATAAGLPNADTVVHLAFFVVAVTLVLHAVTAQRVLAIAGLPGDVEAAGPEVEMLVGDVDGVDLLEVTLTTSSAPVGSALARRPPDPRIRVLLVRRGGTTFAADGSTVMRPGDHLVVAVDDRATGIARVERWLRDPSSSEGLQSSGTLGTRRPWKGT